MKEQVRHESGEKSRLGGLYVDLLCGGDGGGYVALKEDVAVGETRKGDIRRGKWIDGCSVEMEYVDDRDGYVVWEMIDEGEMVFRFNEDMGWSRHDCCYFWNIFTCAFAFAW